MLRWIDQIVSPLTNDQRIAISWYIVTEYTVVLLDLIRFKMAVFILYGSQMNEFVIEPEKWRKSSATWMFRLLLITDFRSQLSECSTNLKMI